MTDETSPTVLVVEGEEEKRIKKGKRKICLQNFGELLALFYARVCI